MKIYIVKTEGRPAPKLVRAHTRAGAERFVRDQIKPTVTAHLPTQDELVAALDDKIAIEDATVISQETNDE